METKTVLGTLNLFEVLKSEYRTLNTEWPMMKYGGSKYDG